VTTYADEVEFFGHPMVRSAHRSTIEVTRDVHLTPRGDCIIGVRADKALADLTQDVKEAIRLDGSEIVLTLDVPPEKFTFRARGSSGLVLHSNREMVIRKSDYLCERTLAIKADASAMEIPRAIVERLRDPECRGLLRIEVRD
jgi:hypothetical protein